MIIASPPRPPTPDELEALIEEARRRARRRRWGALLVLAALGATLYLIVGHGGGGGGSATRSAPSPGGSGAAQHSPASSSAPTLTSCALGRATGDFDGDGASDVARLVALVSPGQGCDRALVTRNPRVYVHVVFASGARLDYRLRRCGYSVCGGSFGQPFRATDLDGDGRSELALGVGPGAAIDNVEFFRVARRAIYPLRIAPEQTAKADVRPGPAILGGSFDSGGISPVACLVRPDGGRVLVSIQAMPIGSSLNGPWRVHRAELALRADTLHVVRVSTTTTAHGFHSHGFRFHGPWPQFQVGCS